MHNVVIKWGSFIASGPHELPRALNAQINSTDDGRVKMSKDSLKIFDETSTSDTTGLRLKIGNLAL